MLSTYRPESGDMPASRDTAGSMHPYTQIHLDDMSVLIAEVERYRRLMSALHKLWPELAVVIEQVLDDGSWKSSTGNLASS